MVRAELARDFKRNVGIIAVKVVVVALLAVTLYNLMTFLVSTDDAVSAGFSERGDVNIYSVHDTLADPARFEDFRSDPGAVSRVCAFYDELNESAPGEFLSMFNQHLVVEDFRGGSEFDVRSGSDYLEPGDYQDPSNGRLVTDVKSVQMNQKTFEFYGLKVGTGQEPNWVEVDYLAGTVPVLLGESYRGVYGIGDTFDANFYSLDLEFEVVGYLTPNASVYYQGSMDFFLDDFVVFPYPPSLTGYATDEPLFRGILSFAMINGNYAVGKTTSFDRVARDLADIGTRTGFQEYGLMNVPEYLVQYSLTRDLLKQNLTLVIVIHVAGAFAALFVTYMLSSWLFQRRRRRNEMIWILGGSNSSIMRLQLSESVVQWLIICGLVVLVVDSLPNRDFWILSRTLLWLLALSMVEVFLLQAALRRSLTSPRVGVDQT
jgi:hypothetical protein